MIARTLDAGVPCAWVLADALYGSDSALRLLLEDRGQPYVLAMRTNHSRIRPATPPYRAGQFWFTLMLAERYARA